MAKYKVGDLIEAVTDNPSRNDYILAGDTGTVCCLSRDAPGRIGVAWDKLCPKGHSCDETCEYGHGWYVDSDEIGLYEPVEDINATSFLKIIVQSNNRA